MIVERLVDALLVSDGLHAQCWWWVEFSKYLAVILSFSLVQVMFEQYRFDGVYIAIQAVLTLYAQGKRTGPGCCKLKRMNALVQSVKGVQLSHEKQRMRPRVFVYSQWRELNYHTKDREWGLECLCTINEGSSVITRKTSHVPGDKNLNHLW